MLASFLRFHSRGAYARDNNTSARLCTTNAGRAQYARGGGVFAGHYGNYIIVGSLSTLSLHDYLLQLQERSLVPRALPDFRQNLGVVWE